MKTNLTLATLILAAGLSVTHARDSVWDATTGVSPELLNPPWGLYVEISAVGPFWTNGAVRIESTSSDYEYYDQAGYHPARPLAMPARLVIEARMRLVSGTRNSATRAPAMISFVTQPAIGSALNIDVDGIFLYSSGAGHGPHTNVDTTLTPHTYRIEVNGLALGSEIKVFYDGTNVLTGTTWSSAALLGNTPRIVWGDGTSAEGGVSDWYSFYHNALVPAADEHVLYGGIGNYLVTLNRTNGMAADLGPLPGIPSGNYIRTMSPSPDGQFFATVEPASGYYPSLAKINPATREATVIGPLTNGAGGLVVWLEGLAYNARERQIYGSVSLTGSGSASPVLVTLNPTTAVATVVCTVTNASGGQVDMDSIVFLDSGELVGLDVFYVGGGSYNTLAYEVYPNRSLASTGFFFAVGDTGMPALDRRTGRWYFSQYDARRLAWGNIAYEGLQGSGVTHSTSDFGGGRLLGLAFPYDYAHPYLRLSIQPGVQVGWPTLANWNYQLQACADLATCGWTNCGPVVPGNGQTNWVPDSTAAAQKFYRVRVED
ncbi:MAG: hypothetical protein HZA90_20325 [Verrucomicrobia bacterium]|nr:hypothetical protein [Verrucomicrobiota bacterium]